MSKKLKITKVGVMKTLFILMLLSGVITIFAVFTLNVLLMLSTAILQFILYLVMASIAITDR